MFEVTFSCRPMQTTCDAFAQPMTERARNRLATLLIKLLLQFSQNNQPALLSHETTRKIFGWLAHLYGFEVGGLLEKEGLQRAMWNLLQSVGEYGIESPQQLKAPISVVWSLSYRCNLHCMHCYQNASNPSPDELTLSEQLEIVDQLSDAGVSMVVLSGGEPLTNPNLRALIERIRSREMEISIDSNGVLVNREMANYLKSAGVLSIELSLDGADAQSHDRFRGLDGAFNKTLDAVEFCSDAGIFTTVATTATKLSYAKRNELITLARSRGAGRVVFFDLVPAGRGRDVQDLRLSADELNGLMELVRKESSEDGEVFTELPQFVVYSSVGDGESASNCPETALSIERFTVSSFFDCAGHGNIYRKLARYLGGCPAGRLYCNIQPNGNVTPCMFMPEYPIAGNLRQQSFQNIWNHSQVFRDLRNRRQLKGRCRSCNHILICGGCRAKAAAYSGDYLSADPTCPIRSENM